MNYSGMNGLKREDGWKAETRAEGSGKGIIQEGRPACQWVSDGGVKGRGTRMILDF
jgi:hypothetical protein